MSQQLRMPARMATSQPTRTWEPPTDARPERLHPLRPRRPPSGSRPLGDAPPPRKSHPGAPTWPTHGTGPRLRHADRRRLRAPPPPGLAHRGGHLRARRPGQRDDPRQRHPRLDLPGPSPPLGVRPQVAPEPRPDLGQRAVRRPSPAPGPVRARARPRIPERAGRGRQVVGDSAPDRRGRGAAAGGLLCRLRVPGPEHDGRRPLHPLPGGGGRHPRRRGRPTAHRRSLPRGAAGGVAGGIPAELPGRPGADRPDLGRARRPPLGAS